MACLLFYRLKKKQWGLGL